MIDRCGDSLYPGVNWRNELTIVDATNCVQFLSANPSKTWNINRDFPHLVPPWPTSWFEYSTSGQPLGELGVKTVGFSVSIEEIQDRQLYTDPLRDWLDEDADQTLKEEPKAKLAIIQQHKSPTFFQLNIEKATHAG